MGVYQSQGAKDNATLQKMESYRKQAVMMDAIEDYRAELDDAQDKGPGYQGVGDGLDRYRDEEMTEDEFLATCQSSKRMVCSFFHREFRRCDMLHEIVAKIAHHHIETKFCKLNAQQAPFFVTKLMVQTLPCLIMFEDGKVCGRLDGLDLIGGDDALNNETIEVVLGAAGVIHFKPPEEWVDDNKEQYADIIGLNEATRLNSDDDEW